MKDLLLESSYLKYSTILIFTFLTLYLNAQKIFVIDEERRPLSGVLVYSDNKKISVYTGKNGEFLIKNLEDSIFLNFYFFGFKHLREPVSKILKKNNPVIMIPVRKDLDEVIIIGRNNQFLEDIIPQTNVISSKDIQVTESKSTADALMMSGNVFVQKSQFGGGSPVLRGFEANRVLLVLDGIRMNNAIYRNGHIQNSITVDNFSLKRIEVIFGAGSLNYGSDAIGGVIHFKTKDPVFNFAKVNYKIRYSSAANENTAYLGFNYGKKKIANLFIFSSSSFDNLRAGNKRPKEYREFGKRKKYVKIINGIDTIVENKNYNIQIGTAYSQYNLLNKTAIKIKNGSLITFNIQYTNSGNIPRYDFLTEEKNGVFKYAEWYYGPQKRFLGSLKFDLNNTNKAYDKGTIIAATQKLNEDRIYRKFRDEWKNFNMERLWINSFSADFKKYIHSNRNHELVYGLDIQHNDLNSTANRQNVTTGEIDFNLMSRYPSGLAINFRYGAYLQYIFGEKDYPVQVNIGSRIEHNNIKVKYQKNSFVIWPDKYFSGVENKNTSYAYSVGAKYKLPYLWKISSNLSSAFRNPNIDDLAKIRVKKGEILVPNLNLKSENSFNAEFSVSKKIKFKKNHLTFNLTGFYTILNNAIIRQPFNLPDGNTIYIDGNDTLNVIANQNVQKEKVYGISTTLNAKLNDLNFSANLVYTKGIVFDETLEIKPAPHIPPLFGNIKISYYLGHFESDFILMHNSKKSIELYGGSEDNPENATVDGSYAWTTYNFYLRYKLNKYFRFNCAIENIMDIHYRPFSSGVSSSGRNFIIGISGNI